MFLEQPHSTKDPLFTHRGDGPIWIAWQTWDKYYIIWARYSTISCLWLGFWQLRSMKSYEVIWSHMNSYEIHHLPNVSIDVSGDVAAFWAGRTGSDIPWEVTEEFFSSVQMELQDVTSQQSLVLSGAGAISVTSPRCTDSDGIWLSPLHSKEYTRLACEWCEGAIIKSRALQMSTCCLALCSFRREPLEVRHKHIMNKLEQQDQKLSQILDAIKKPAANLDGGLDAI